MYMSLLNQRKKGAAETKPPQADPVNEILTLELPLQEIDELMNYLINSNAGIQIFLRLNARIDEAKKIKSETNGKG